MTPFASAAARDAAITSPVQGMVCAITGEGRYYGYDGATWQRIGYYSIAGRTGAALRRVAAQSIANNTDTLIQWDTEDSDSDSFIGTPSTTVTIPSGFGGIYSITAFATGPANWQSTTAARLDVIVGATAFSIINGNLGSTDTTFGGTLVIPVAAAAAITFNVRHAFGSAQNFTATLSIFRWGL